MCWIAYIVPAPYCLAHLSLSAWGNSLTPLCASYLNVLLHHSWIPRPQNQVTMWWNLWNYETKYVLLPDFTFFIIFVRVMKGQTIVRFHKIIQGIIWDSTLSCLGTELWLITTSHVTSWTSYLFSFFFFGDLMIIKVPTLEATVICYFTINFYKYQI